MICERCAKSSTVYIRPTQIDIAHRKYVTQGLCANCFCVWVERQFCRAIAEEKLIQPEDRVMVALSGGKDSQLMLTLLAAYRKTCPFDWIGVSVDEGITGYRAIGLEIVRAAAQKFGLPHITISYRETYGLTLDQMVLRAEQSGTIPNASQRACLFCGPPRVRLMLNLGQRLGYNVLALGRNLDDLVADTLLYMCTPHGLALLTNFRGRSSSRPSDINCVNLLWKLTDKEIALYCRLKNIPYQLEPECPYSNSMLGDKMRHHVHAIEETLPGFRYAFAKGVEQLQEHLPEYSSSPPTCIRCNQIYSPDSVGDCCPTCAFNSLIEDLGGHAAKMLNLTTLDLPFA